MAATSMSASVESQAVQIEEMKHDQTADGEMPFVRFLVIGGGLGLLSLLLIRLWQGEWWFPVGMDATTPEFAKYWLGLLYVEWIVLIAAAIIGFTAYRKPCPICVVQRKELGRIDPEHELNHIGKLWAMVAVAATFGFGVSYFAEQDAVWHQIVVRDTAFTPATFRSSSIPFPC